MILILIQSSFLLPVYCHLNKADESKAQSTPDTGTNFERSRSLDITKLVTSQLFTSSLIKASNAPFQQARGQGSSSRFGQTSRTNSADRTGKSHYYDSSGGGSVHGATAGGSGAGGTRTGGTGTGPSDACGQGKTASSEAVSTRSKIEGASGDESHIKAGKYLHSLTPFVHFLSLHSHAQQQQQQQHTLQQQLLQHSNMYTRRVARKLQQQEATCIRHRPLTTCARKGSFLASILHSPQVKSR